jgi:hypothetical protein
MAVTPDADPYTVFALQIDLDGRYTRRRSLHSVGSADRSSWPLHQMLIPTLFALQGDLNGRYTRC